TPDALPVPDDATLGQQPLRVTLVGDFDVERERPLRLALALVVDLGQDLVAEIEVLARYARLRRIDHQAHEFRRSRGLVFGLAEFRDRVELADGDLLIRKPEGRQRRQEDGERTTASPRGRIGSIAEFSIVDRPAPRTPYVFLGDEIRGPVGLGVIP